VLESLDTFDNAGGRGGGRGYGASIQVIIQGGVERGWRNDTVPAQVLNGQSKNLQPRF
jgi:hypothetical protein